MMNRWYRAYEGTVTDPKLGEVALLANVSRSVVIAVWHAILESCASTQDGGRFETNPRRVAAALCEPLDVIERVFAGLTEVGMVADGVAVAWRERQFESDSSTERSRKHREHKRNGDATLQQQHATPPETETETETETDTEKKDFRRAAKATDADFDEFWKSYPRRSGDNPKQPAKKVFIAAVKQGADPKDIISGVRLAAARNRDKIGTAYIPQAVKWLRDRRWEDHLAQGQQTNPAAPERDWRAIVQRYKDHGLWTATGPEPDCAGCQAPPEVLREFGYAQEPVENISRETSTAGAA